MGIQQPGSYLNRMIMRTFVVPLAQYQTHDLQTLSLSSHLKQQMYVIVEEQTMEPMPPSSGWGQMPSSQGGWGWDIENSKDQLAIHMKILTLSSLNVFTHSKIKDLLPLLSLMNFNLI